MHKYTNTENCIEKINIKFVVILFAIFSGFNLFFRKINFPYCIEESFISYFFIGGSLSYYFAYELFFCKILWKKGPFQKLFATPNLNGVWKIKGNSTNITKVINNQYKAEIEIKQEFSKISICMKTKMSYSKSITAELTRTSDGRYELKYLYLNTPESNDPQNMDMRMHYGHCTLTFSTNLKKANGRYFNDGRERTSYGNMEITRS